MTCFIEKKAIRDLYGALLVSPLIEDARRWKRLVRQGWWWYLIRALYCVPRDRWQAHQAAFSVSASDNQQEAHRKHEIRWGVKRSATVRAIKREMPRSRRCFIPLWFTAGLISCFSDTVMAAKVVNNRCSSDKKTPATRFYVWTLQLSREIGLQK